MVAQEKTCVPESEAVLPSGNSVMLDVGSQSGMEEGHMPKIRKPYTITKQRERWTEEEHKKFIEALKLYGRAWRKIEEHVGSKTAVQIRSHAQKFFSKVVRETNNSNTSSTEPIEIPPPRPKRKPAHPYPRKLALPLKRENPMEPRDRSASPNSSLSEQENQSPTSVLSAVDTLASGDSMSLEGSPSPISSADAINQVGLLVNEDDTFQAGLSADEDKKSQAGLSADEDTKSQAGLSANEDKTCQADGLVSQSAPSNCVSVKLELFPSIDTFDKPELPSHKVLKLFGKEVVIPSKPFEASLCLSKSPSLNMGEGVVQASPENSQSVDIAMGSGENFLDNRAHCHVDGSWNQVEKPTPLPWWVFFRGGATPPYENTKDEYLREGSCAGSSSELVNAVRSTDSNSDAEAQSGQSTPLSDKESNCSEASNLNSRPALLEKRKSIDISSKGFVPYKRCFSERNMGSSTITSDEKECQRIRLCL